jgi:hypothetical protein
MPEVNILQAESIRARRERRANVMARIASSINAYLFSQVNILSCNHERTFAEEAGHPRRIQLDHEAYLLIAALSWLEGM